MEVASDCSNVDAESLWLAFVERYVRNSLDAGFLLVLGQWASSVLQLRVADRQLYRLVTNGLDLAEWRKLLGELREIMEWDHRDLHRSTCLASPVIDNGFLEVGPCIISQEAAKQDEVWCCVLAGYLYRVDALFRQLWGAARWRNDSDAVALSSLADAITALLALRGCADVTCHNMDLLEGFTLANIRDDIRCVRRMQLQVDLNVHYR